MLADVYSRPLLCRIELLPDESLPSYLSRLAAANHYEPTSILTTICNKHLSALGIRDNLQRPKHPETYDVLSFLTCTCPRTLANASVHRLARAPILAQVEKHLICLSDGQSFQLLLTPARSRKLRRDEQAQFCPDCLREAAYHHLSWIPLDVSACLKHQCLLVERCHNCHAWVGLHDVVRRRCRICGADLAEAIPDYIQDNPLALFAQRTIQTWWGFDTPPADRSAWTLPAQPVSVLYRLFDWLRNSLRTRWEADYHRRLTSMPPDPHVIQMMVFKVLVNWPQGFFDFLRACLEWEIRTDHRFYYSGPICLKAESQFAFWVHEFQEWPGFRFVQEAVDQFLAESNWQVSSVLWGTRTRIRVQVSEEFQRALRLNDTSTLGSLAALPELGWDAVSKTLK